MTSGCLHQKVQFIYRRDGIDYVHCVDCDLVLEAEDLETVPVHKDQDEP